MEEKHKVILRGIVRKWARTVREPYNEAWLLSGRTHNERLTIMAEEARKHGVPCNPEEDYIPEFDPAPPALNEALDELFGDNIGGWPEFLNLMTVAVDPSTGEEVTAEEEAKKNPGRLPH